MEQSETNETAAIESVEAREASPFVAPARSVASPVITQGAPGCPTCGTAAGAQGGGIASSSYVYALGQIETRFPRPSVEKEMEVFPFTLRETKARSDSTTTSQKIR